MTSNNKPIVIWLFTGALMIFVMIVIGGTTRLTGSGLSIVEWNVVKGVIPPMNEVDWQTTFEKYQAFPQYKIDNKDMTLSEFKSIYWWEFIHRFWGRLIGIVFIVPLLFFWAKKKLSRNLKKHLVIAGLMGAFQGGLGWFMVASGLIDKPWVSPYRLAAHFITALVLFSYLLLLAFKLMEVDAKSHPFSSKAKKYLKTLLILFTVQLFYGALMSGHKAAVYFPTFPDFNGAFLPNDILSESPLWTNLFESIPMIQIIHRTLGIVLFGLVLFFGLKLIKENYAPLLRSSSLLVAITTIQVLLGISTLVFSRGHVPVTLGVIHQAVVVLILTVLMYLFAQVSRDSFFRLSNKN